MSLSSPLVLAFGDSLVAGYGLPVADGFAAQLERRLRATHPGARVLNEGRSGDTTPDAFSRLGAVLSRLKQRPGLAVVQLGPNDVFQRVPPATTRANLDAILREFGRCAVPVLLTTVTPPPVLASQASVYAGIHAELAACHGAIMQPFFPAGVLGDPNLVLADRVHPNAKAIARVVSALLPAIEEVFVSDRRLRLSDVATQPSKCLRSG